MHNSNLFSRVRSLGLEASICVVQEQFEVLDSLLGHVHAAVGLVRRQALLTF